MSIIISPEPNNIGTIHAHLFENAATGTHRDIYWSIYCPCAPIVFEGEEWQTSLACEWLTWPVKDWRFLGGVNLDSVKMQELVECSFYLGTHHPVALTELTLRAIPSTTRFLVHIGGQAQLTGYDELDGIHGFTADFEVDFTGLVVVPDNLYPKPCTGEEAATALASFVALPDYHEPHWDRFRYVFRPRSSNYS